MRTAKLHSWPAAQIVADAAVCAGAAALVVSATALVVAISGLANDMRDVLRLGFGGVEHTPTEALRIALHNARLAAGILLCAIARPRIPTPIRAALDTLLATVLALSAGSVGVALGAYGGRLLASTVSHVPLEFGALALAGGAYMRARKHAVSTRALALVAGACAVLLGIAGVLEAYVSCAGGAR